MPKMCDLLSGILAYESMLQEGKVLSLRLAIVITFFKSASAVRSISQKAWHLSYNVTTERKTLVRRI